MQVLNASVKLINGQPCNLKDDEIALIDDEQCVLYCFLLWIKTVSVVGAIVIIQDVSLCKSNATGFPCLIGSSELFFEGVVLLHYLKCQVPHYEYLIFGYNSTL